MDLFYKIRPILISHRVAIEADLRKTGQGAYPPPFEVMERLLSKPESVKFDLI